MAEIPIHLESREHDGARQYAPSASRNKGIIGQQLVNILPKHARVLEIASGTGEHAVHMCMQRRDLWWQPSDPNLEARQSQNAWANKCAGQIGTSLNIDVTKAAWETHVENASVIFCSNMIHIAPWEATLGLAKGAGELLGPDGIVVLYGPFLEEKSNAASNLEFDRALKARNAEWGVRFLESVKHIFALAGFNSAQRIAMPKNNLLLVFRQS
ncbi:MAG: DUF938 domain-containing protein [Maricaulaceae bacterium]